MTKTSHTSLKVGRKYLTKPSLVTKGAIANYYSGRKGSGFYFTGLGLKVRKWKADLS